MSNGISLLEGVLWVVGGIQAFRYFAVVGVPDLKASCKAILRFVDWIVPTFKQSLNRWRAM